MAPRSPRCVLAFHSQQPNVKRPYTRFFMEPSREHDGLVHIRSCYDNRYWAAQRRPHDGSWVVAAGAEEADEDLSRPTCTLFRPTRVDTSGSVRLLHVHTEKYVCLPCSSSDNTITLGAISLSLHKEDGEDDLSCTFTVQNLLQQFILPRYVAFKGDNGMYLRARIQERHEYLEFSGRDIRDEAVLNTIHTNDDGTFRVRSNYTGKFWRRSPNWIWADSDGGATDDSHGDTLFRAIRLCRAGGFFVALQNLGNGYYCKRLTTEGKRNCLNAGTPTITADARLQLVEAVVSREICNVVFSLSKPRIYGKSVVTMATASVLNGTSSNNTAKLTLEYTNTEKRTWGSCVTLKLDGVATSIRAGIPVIIEDGNVEVSSEFNKTYSWGSTIEKKATQKVSYEVTVPPKMRVAVVLTAKRASCDIPFSYTQRDILVDGREIMYDMDDGLYTGVNCYNFSYVTSEQNM
ncbi:unnamed protein product [Urochloa humidicola]